MRMAIFSCQAGTGQIRFRQTSPQSRQVPPKVPTDRFPTDYVYIKTGVYRCKLFLCNITKPAVELCKLFNDVRFESAMFLNVTLNMTLDVQGFNVT